MALDGETIRRIYDEWVASSPDDASTFGGQDGHLHFADDEKFWEKIEAEERRQAPKSE